MADPIGNVKPVPEPYNLDDPDEVLRLYRECMGYLSTCKKDHHGTDFKGRQYAIEGLGALITKTNLLRRSGAAERRAAHTATERGEK